MAIALAPEDIAIDARARIYAGMAEVVLCAWKKAVAMQNYLSTQLAAHRVWFLMQTRI